MNEDNSHSALLAPAPFVGRAAELARLGALWQTVRAGGARAAGVEGGPGIGKTVLVRHFVAAASPRTVIWASGDEAEAHLPWGVLDQIAAALPPSPGENGAARSGTHSDPVFAGQALAAALSSLGEAIVVIDDAHWSDQLSMAALRSAARRLVAEPVLLVLVYQPAGQAGACPGQRPSPGVGDGWRRLLESGQGTALRLGGLAPADLVRLAVASGRPGLSLAGAVRLHEHTGGHPLHVRHLLDEVPMRSITFGHGTLPAPRQLTLAMSARLAGCQPATRELAEAAAVLGRRARLAAVQNLSGVTDAGAAIAEAEAAQLLAEVPGTAGREVSFTSSLVMGLVYHGISPDRRRDLHRRAAQQGGPGAVWHRIAAATGADEELAAAIWAQALRHQAAGKVALSAVYFLHALELTPPGPARTPRLLTAVECLLVAGDTTAALEYTGEIAGASGAWADYVAGYLFLVAGEVQAARSRLTGAWEQLSLAPAPAGPEPADLPARVATQLAVLGLLQNNPQDMISFGAAAVAGAQQPGVAAFAWFAKCVGLAVSGRSEEALCALETAGSPGSPSGLDGLVARGVIRLWTDDLPGARQDLASAVARAIAGEPLRVAQALGFLGEVEYRAGALSEAIVHGEAAVGDAQENNRVWDYPMLHALASYPLAAAGQWERAEFHAAQAAELADQVGTPAGFAYAAAATAALAQARDDATAVLTAAQRLERHYPAPEPGTHLAGPLRAEALAQLGRPGEAREALAAFLERTARGGRRGIQVAVFRARSRIAAAEGKYEDALAQCRLAVRAAQEAGLRLEKAKAELLSGEYQVAAGRRAAAELLLRPALREFTAMGAMAYAAQATAALEQAGLPAAPPHGLPGALTPAERAVTAGVCEGLANRQIAERLFLSTKTVEFHLTNVFRKMDVRNRAELRQAACEPRVPAGSSRGPAPKTPGANGP